VLQDILSLPFRALVVALCAVFAAIAMPFLVIGHLFGLIEPGHMPS
jgi:hypothetical protein